MIRTIAIAVLSCCAWAAQHTLTTDSGPAAEELRPIETEPAVDHTPTRVPWFVASTRALQEDDLEQELAELRSLVEALRAQKARLEVELEEQRVALERAEEERDQAARGARELEHALQEQADELERRAEEWSRQQEREAEARTREAERAEREYQRDLERYEEELERRTEEHARQLGRAAEEHELESERAQEEYERALERYAGAMERYEEQYETELERHEARFDAEVERYEAELERYEDLWEDLEGVEGGTPLFVGRVGGEDGTTTPLVHDLLRRVEHLEEQVERCRRGGCCRDVDLEAPLPAPRRDRAGGVRYFYVAPTAPSCHPRRARLFYRAAEDAFPAPPTLPAVPEVPAVPELRELPELPELAPLPADPVSWSPRSGVTALLPTPVAATVDEAELRAMIEEMVEEVRELRGVVRELRAGTRADHFTR